MPQLLTKDPRDFLWAAGELAAMGYKCVNLNAGCPSGTVTAKGKGAGMLADPAALDGFLAGIFDKAPCRISVKTRLGISDPKEFSAILEVYNKYPIDELIIHPRVRKDFYRERVRTEHFSAALEKAAMPLSFNGGLVSVEDCRDAMERCKNLEAIMLGRGLLSDPFLAARVKGLDSGGVDTIREFHLELFETYAQQFQSSNNAMFRMKELWSYLIRCFEGGEKLGKAIKKAGNASEFLSATERVFRELSLAENKGTDFNV